LTMRPNVPDERFVFGAPRFTRFVALYASALNSIEWLSRKGIENFLKIEKSELNNPGPTRMPRPVLPNVPGALMANALVLNHCRIFAAFGRSPENDGFPTWSARSEPIPLNELSSPEAMVSGRPVCM